MLIGGLQKTTLVDYPGKIAAIVFTVGCNFNCGYCHNAPLRTTKERITDSEFFEFLNTRKGKLDAVVITGGEPTLQSDLIEFAKKIKDLNYLLKLDSQGSNPDVIAKMLDQKLIDYIAMDIKGPLHKYSEVINCAVDEEKIKRSIELVMTKSPDYEFRTTVVSDQLNLEDFENMGELLKGARRFFIQKFVPAPIMNDPAFASRLSPDPDTLNQMQKIMGKYVDTVEIR